jgi:hypothetical protein
MGSHCFGKCPHSESHIAQAAETYHFSVDHVSAHLSSCP